jgi:hypothetical protein
VGLLSAAELTIDGRSVPHDDVVGDVDLPSFELRVTGQPQGKGRPRFDPARKRTYTPKETKVAEREVRAAWEEVGEPRLPDDQAIAVVVRLVVVRPAGHFKKDGSLSAEGLRHPLPRNKKPDVVRTPVGASSACSDRSPAYARGRATRENAPCPLTLLPPAATSPTGT